VDPAVLAAIQTIYDEIEEVFPSGYTMMGGDEVNLGAIQDLPEIKAAAAQLGANATGYDLYRQFIVEMHSYSTKAGRELVVWEGFAPAGGQTGRSAHPVCVSF
jgi:N-acetyl-beta-hexosaminidase